MPAPGRGDFSLFPAKNRVIPPQYQGVPDGAWLATSLISPQQPRVNRKTLMEREYFSGLFFMVHLF
jgi:hypothetical protein